MRSVRYLHIRREKKIDKDVRSSNFFFSQTLSNQGDIDIFGEQTNRQTF